MIWLVLLALYFMYSSKEEEQSAKILELDHELSALKAEIEVLRGVNHV